MQSYINPGMNSYIKTKKNLKTVVCKSTYTYDKELRDAALQRLHHSSSSQTFLPFFPSFRRVSGVDAVAGEGRCLFGLFRCSRRRCRVIDSSPTMRGTAISQHKKHTKTNSPLFGRRCRRRKTYCTAFTSGTHSYSFVDVINNLQCYLPR